MSKEFVWNIAVDDGEKLFKVVVHESEIVTYEGDEEKKHIKITNPQSKQGVLQIDTVTMVYGMECPIQLERNIPYIKIGKQWVMSATTYEDRKKKLVHTHKMSAIILCVACVVICLVVLAKYLITGEVGDWWFMIVMGTIMGATGLIQYKDIKDQIKTLEKAEAEEAAAAKK